MGGSGRALSGASAVRIGAHSYIGGGTTITQDVLPYSMTSSERDTHAYMLNKVGLQRREVRPERIARCTMHSRCCWLRSCKYVPGGGKIASESAPGEDVETLLKFYRIFRTGESLSSAS